MSEFSPEEVVALKETFREQAQELLESYSRHALDLENARRPGELLKVLQRVVHTVKGDSMSLEFDDLAKMAHRLEDLLHALRGSEQPLTRELVDLLLACGDAMSDLLTAYCAEPPRPPRDHSGVWARLDAALGAPTAPVSEAGSLRYRLAVTFSRDCQMRSVGTFLIRRRLEPLGRVLTAEPDPESPAIEQSRTWILVVESTAEPKDLRRAARIPGVSSRVSLRVLQEAPARQVDKGGAEWPGPNPQLSEPGVARSSASGNHLRVQVSKVDRIMNLVGELVIGRSMVAQILQDGSQGEGGLLERLSEANNFLGRSLTELQAAVLKIRMVPVETVFRRFPRVARDVALSSGKKVELEIQGSSTELDKSIIDVIGEPLIHLVRNAIDHGLETEEERRAAGKSPTGRLVIAAHYEGNHVHIRVEDDGRGVDIERVAARATELALVGREEAKTLDRQDLLHLIFSPGFSTRENVSTLSGRGIGLDVVQSTIESLKGTIDVATTPGAGTRFLIRLPLTVAILQALLVQAAGRVLALPLTSVIEIVKLAADHSASILGNDVFRFRERVIPLCRLQDLLDMEPHPEDEPKRGFVLVVGEAERRVAVLVEKIVGENELVVKPIEDPLARSPGIAGASILGDGKVVLILNVHGLTERRHRFNGRVETLG